MEGKFLWLQRFCIFISILFILFLILLSILVYNLWQYNQTLESINSSLLQIGINTQNLSALKDIFELLK